MKSLTGYNLYEDIKNLFILIILGENYSDPDDTDSDDIIKDVYIKSNLDNYIVIDGNTHKIEKVKKDTQFLDTLYKIMSDYKGINNVKIDIKWEGYIYINFEMTYDTYKIEPIDTEVNELYTELYEHHPFVDVMMKDNTTIIKLENEILKNIEKKNNKFYQDIINKIITDGIKSEDILRTQFGSLIIKYNEYLIKIKNFEDERTDDMHELFIGMTTLNNMTTIGIPNFITTYHFMANQKCPKIMDYYEKNCTYTFHEYIEGISLEKSILINSYEDNVKIIKQIIFALYEAYTTYDYTHYDLHYKNIIVKKIDDEIFYYPESNQKMEVNLVPIIIDYEESHVKVENTDYGMISSEANSDNKSFWVHDIFKLLMFLYKQTSSEYNIKILEDDVSRGIIDKVELENIKKMYINYSDDIKKINSYIAELLSYFIEEKMTDELHLKFFRISNYYGVRYSRKFENEKYKFVNFINYVINKI
jgi:hypothetical protein